MLDSIITNQEIKNSITELTVDFCFTDHDKKERYASSSSKIIHLMMRLTELQEVSVMDTLCNERMHCIMNIHMPSKIVKMDICFACENLAGLFLRNPYNSIQPYISMLQSMGMIASFQASL